MNPIAHFIRALGRVPHRPDLYNPYRGPGGPVRRHNLARYLQDRQRDGAHHLLLGEAIGYRGGRLTGIPFVSEDILLNESNAPACFGLARGFGRAGGAGPLWREASATIVWQTIGAVKPLPLLWNALPFHPHATGDRLSNRTPRLKELNFGMSFLPPILALLPELKIIAVGRRAEMALRRGGYDHVAIRHPSHGGKQAFGAGIRRHIG